MIDSMGKPSSAILKASLNWLGDWSQCVTTQPLIYDDSETKTGPHNAYDTKYCIARFKLPAVSYRTINKLVPNNICFGVPFFILAFDFCRLCVVIRFFPSPPQRPMTSDFEGFSIPDFIHYIYCSILILEKEPVFSLWNVQC